MSSCEKCWLDASRIAAQTDVTTTEAYGVIIHERKDNPCSPQEQAGQWWDEGTQSDRRNTLDLAVEPDEYVAFPFSSGVTEFHRQTVLDALVIGQPSPDGTQYQRQMEKA